MKITYDSKSFLIDGERKLILSGEVHYFRMPRAEWKPVLEAAKASGLNAISTYIPWNFHEPREGKWDFAGDHDLEAFLKLCRQQGMLVVARPGPYICAEWDFGGFPAWLHAKGVKHLRTSDVTYMGVVDRYLDKVLSILARHQVSKGGPVFLVQIENEFDHAPQDPAYLRHLEHKFKKKLSVPLFFCLGDTRKGAGAVPGAMLAANFFGQGREHLENLRRLAGERRQPLLVGEFWTGWFDAWGLPAEKKSPEDVENRLTEALSGGAGLLNQYMFFGGTNFGDWAGRSSAGDKCFCTTSYDYDAALSEGLEATDKGRRLGLWCARAACLQEWLLSTELDPSEQPVVPAEVGVTARSKGDLRFLYLNNPTDQEIKGKIQYEDTLYYSLKPGEWKLFPFHIPVSPNLSLRASSHPYLFKHLGNRTVVLVWGENGEKVNLFGTGTLDVTERTNESVHLEHERKGFTLSAQVQERPQKLLAKVLFESGKREVLFLVLNRRLAERMHLHPEKPELVVGAAEVDFDAKRVRLESGSQTLLLASPARVEEVFLNASEVAPKKASLASGGFFGEQALLKHLEGRKDWKEGRIGADLAEYGFQSSRAWYKVKFRSSSKGRKALVFPGVEDQFALFHKGACLGLYGRLARRPKVELTVSEGENELLILAASWGRYNFGTKLGEKKGFLLPIYDGGELVSFAEGWHFLEAAGPLDLKIFSSPSFSGRGWEVDSLPQALARKGYVCARKKFSVPSWARRVRLGLHAGNVNIQVALNGQLIDQHPDSSGSSYKDIELTPNLIPGENTVALFFKGPTQGFERCEMQVLGPELPVTLQVCEGVFEPGEVAVLKDKGWSKSKKAAFGFWRATFKAPLGKGLSSAWLKLGRHGRGSLWLNGQALGRHWSIGPQKEFKLPLSWLKPSNEILVFEEEEPLSPGGEVSFRFKPEESKLP